MTDPATIAAGLTEAQRSGIVHAKPFAFGAWLLPLGTARGLTALGCASRTIDGMCLTPLGLGVRRHILGSASCEKVEIDSGPVRLCRHGSPLGQCPQQMSRGCPDWDAEDDQR